MFPFEYWPFGEKIIAWVRKILGKDPNNPKWRDSKFCVAMDPELEWVSMIGIGGIKGELVVVTVNFEKYPIKCHFYGSLAHFIRECQAFRAW